MSEPIRCPRCGSDMRAEDERDHLKKINGRLVRELRAVLDFAKTERVPLDGPEIRSIETALAAAKE